jgi:hypothetical protein
MSGEGTGGGGALAVLLALWVGAMAFVMAQEPLRQEPEVADDAPIVVEAEEVVVLDEASVPTPTPAPRPVLPECEGDACTAAVTRAELAEAFSRAFQLPVTTIDFFTDDENLPQQAAINRMAAAGITSGCGEDRFCPEGTVTRGQMASFLDRALELPEADRDYFTDDDGIVHEGAINRVAAAGLTVGCDEGRYCPDGEVTWRQLIIFLERALALEDAVA